MYTKVKDQPDLVRDSHSGAIINANGDIVAAARMRKRRVLKSNADVSTLRREIDELKQLVQTLINTNNER